MLLLVFSQSQHTAVVCVSAQKHSAEDTSQNPKPCLAPLATMALSAPTSGNEKVCSGLGLMGELPNHSFWEVL